MSSHRNFGIDDAANQVGTLFAAFDLHHFRPRFFHKTSGIADRLHGVSLIGAERHIPHQQRMLHAATSRAGVVQHLLNCDRKRVFVAKYRLGQ